MNSARSKQFLTGAVVTLLACHLTVWAVAAIPTTAPEIAPADTGVFIEMQNLAKLRINLEKDPLFTVASNLIPVEAGWQTLKKMMKMAGPELLDRYLGTTVALIGKVPHIPWAVFPWLRVRNTVHVHPKACRSTRRARLRW